jgi:hypothetical protein
MPLAMRSDAMPPLPPGGITPLAINEKGLHTNGKSY